MRRKEAFGGERTKDVTKERIAELKAKIAKLKKS